MQSIIGADILWLYLTVSFLLKLQLKTKFLSYGHGLRKKLLNELAAL